MFTVRDEAERDFTGALKKVASIGYKGIEFAGYYGMQAQELRKVLEDLGLQAVNSHVPLENLAKDVNKEIEYAKLLGMEAITVPYLSEAYRMDASAFLKTSKLIAGLDECCSKAGMQLCYHNHDFEFNRIGTEFILDIFLKESKGLKLELDTFWTSYAGVDTVEYMERQASRLQFMHLKDMIKAEKPVFAEVGEGCLDIGSFIEKASEIGVRWAFVEQDVCRRPSLESAETSFMNIKKLDVFS